MQKEEQFLEKRLIDLSRVAYNRSIITYSDFLNLNELSILHAIPKQSLFSEYITFGGYEFSERQMVAFLPDALSLRTGIYSEEIGSYFEQNMCVLRIQPLNRKYAEPLSHRDYLGAILNLGIERSQIGDILVLEKEAVIFAKASLAEFLMNELTRIRHTSVMMSQIELQHFEYHPKFEEVKGTVASIRLDSCMALAFASSRTKLTGLIEGGKVYVNGRIMTSNGYQLKENDIISVRGLGKFQFKEQLSKTKKNRIYVLLYKYV